MKRLSLFLAVVMAVLLVIPAPAQAGDDSGFPLAGMGIFLWTGGWDCDEPDPGRPFAAIKVDKKKGKAPLKVSFDGTNSYDSDGYISSYEWDFGTGGGVTGSSVTYTYDSPGVYEATLTVTDNEGNTDEDHVTITVKSPSKSNKSPTASFNATPTKGTVPLRVNFDASDSNDPDGSIVSYSWDYDNGDVDSGKRNSYTFNNPGTYYVQLQVKDNDGATDSTTRGIEVKAAQNEAPKANFTVSPNSGEVPLQVTCDASSSLDPDGNIVSYSWRFGNGATDSGKHATYTYNQAGEYGITLTVRDNDGATASNTVTVQVNDPEPEDKDVRLSLAQGRTVSWGEWFPLKIDGLGTNGKVTISFPNNVDRLEFRRVYPWRYSVSSSGNRKIVEFWNGPVDRDFQLASVVEIKASGYGEADLELSNAEVYSEDYRLNIQELIGTTIE
ncbi:MAG: PKD domain-containing protein [Candidatus Paceibacterota bacterium]